LKAFKVFETQHFERGIDPRDSMKIGDVKGRLLKKRTEEATQAIDEILDTYGGDGPYFIDTDKEIPGFKIALYQDEPIQSQFKISDSEVRYYIEYNAETEALFVGWEQYDKDGKWKDRQWTSKIPFAPGERVGESDIKTIKQAKQILINYIKSNKLVQ
jgi:hypothetical protein